MEPKPLTFPARTAAGEPRPPLSSSASIMPTEKDSGPKPLALQSRPAQPTMPQHGAPSGLKIPNRARPVDPVTRIDLDHGTINAYSIDGTVRALPLTNRPPPEDKPVARDRIIGGDKRAPALIARAKAIDSVTASDPRFLGRLEAFLRLKPLEWMTWGDQSAAIIATTSQFVAGVSNSIQVANAPRWADETRTAYQKGTTGFFGKKPAFYEQMLTNARDILQTLALEIDQHKRLLVEKLGPLKIDALVLQVCTENVTDAMELQIVDGRMRTMVTSLSNGAALTATLEQSQLMIVKQATDVGQLLTGLIPSWVAAQAKS
jgi:hypothetical protein